MGEAPLLSFYAGFFGWAGYWFRTHFTHRKRLQKAGSANFGKALA
jgi:hypothetical protein